MRCLSPRIVILAFVVSAGCAGSRQPQLVPGNPTRWSELERLTPSTNVRVETRSGFSTGRLLRVDDTNLDVSHPDGVSRITRDDVRRVLVRERQAGRKARLGFSVGAALGLLTAAITAESSRGAYRFMLGGSWGAIGAAIGAIDGAGDVRERVVYDAGHPASCPPSSSRPASRRR